MSYLYLHDLYGFKFMVWFLLVTYLNTRYINKLLKKSTKTFM